VAEDERTPRPGRTPKVHVGRPVRCLDVDRSRRGARLRRAGAAAAPR
jgi:hypothetical protein